MESNDDAKEPGKRKVRDNGKGSNNRKGFENGSLSFPNQGTTTNNDNDDGTTPQHETTNDSSTTTTTTTTTSTTADRNVTTTTTRRVYVGNLHPRVTAVHLESLFQKRQLACESIQFIPTRTTGSDTRHYRSHFCFCTFASRADAVRAMQIFHQRKLLGRPLVVQPAHESSSSSAGPSSFARGTSTTTTRTASLQQQQQQQRQLDEQIRALRQKIQEKRG